MLLAVPATLVKSILMITGPKPQDNQFEFLPVSGCCISNFANAGAANHALWVQSKAGPL